MEECRLLTVNLGNTSLTTRLEMLILAVRTGQCCCCCFVVVVVVVVVWRPPSPGSLTARL